MIYGIDNVGATVDIGHANTTRMLDSFLARIDEASHIHLHDNNGIRDDHFALGRGKINWDKVFGALSSKYAGRYVVEGRNIEEAAASLEFIRRYDL